jgi:hypothetical protein
MQAQWILQGAPPSRFLAYRIALPLQALHRDRKAPGRSDHGQPDAG